MPTCRRPWTCSRPGSREGSDLAAARLLRLARVDRYQPEVEECDEPAHLPPHEPLYDRHPAAPIRQMLAKATEGKAE